MSTSSVESRDDQPFTKWDTWLGTIHEEVTELLVSRYIFREVENIIKANPRIQKPSSFYEWMGTTYVTTATIGVRRQLDKDKRSISIYHLLEEIRSNPEVISRERYVSLCGGRSLGIELVNLDFDEFAGTGRSHVDPAIVMEDLKTLEGKAANLKEYSNKRLAHTDKGGPTVIPTFEQLDKCLDFMEELLKKYLRLFRAKNYISILPVFQYDWKAIFREPWIPKSTPQEK